METTRCSTGSFSPSDLVLSSLSRYEGSCCVTVFAHLFHSSCHCIHFILHPHLSVPLRRILEVLLIKISLSVYFIFYLFIFFIGFFLVAHSFTSFTSSFFFFSLTLCFYLVPLPSSLQFHYFTQHLSQAPPFLKCVYIQLVASFSAPSTFIYQASFKTSEQWNLQICPAIPPSSPHFSIFMVSTVE